MTLALQSPGARLMRRLDALAEHSDDEGALTRLFLSPSHRAAVDTLTGWMREAGLATHLDAIGNLRARLPGADPDAPCLILGSHIDTVRDAGRYDGALGVLAALAAIEELRARGITPAVPVEIVAFGDEEGVRFPTTLSGSRALAGRLPPDALEARDADEITLAQALANFGCDPAGAHGLALEPARVAAYLEVHIEQGPVLQEAGLPLGIVTAISGATRFSVTVEGMAGHAGTVPMGLRRDALAAAAEMILAIESRARCVPDCVATVGRIEALPGAPNVVPGRVRFSIDARSPCDRTRDQLVKEIAAEMTMLAQARGVTLSVQKTHDQEACPCDTGLIARLGESLARRGVAEQRLPSGAGHDGMAFRGLWPVGMLFVRCRDGISHNPAESIMAEDAALAVEALVDFITRFRP